MQADEEDSIGKERMTYLVAMETWKLAEARRKLDGRVVGKCSGDVAGGHEGQSRTLACVWAAVRSECYVWT